jgi:hypothetical protein
MAKRKTLTNEVFGHLTHVEGDFWKRPIDLKIFGKVWNASLMVDIDPKDGVEKNQIAAFNTFNTNATSILAESEREIVSHYKAVCAKYRTRYGITDPNDEKVPIIKSAKELYRLMETEGVTFPYARRHPTFGLLFQCSWEEEHGLAVKYVDEKLVEIGFQDIIL